MRTVHLLCPLALVAALSQAGAQTLQTAVFPSWAKKVGNSQSSFPFAGSPMRYQQVIQGADLAKVLKSPARLRGVAFRAKMTGLKGHSVTMEVWIGKASSTISSFFNSNLINPVPVFPKASITLPTSTAGAWVLNIPFRKEFTWDGKSNFVLDVRIHGNSNRNRSFFYQFDGVVAGPTKRLYSTTGPNATTATFNQNGVGLVVRFSYVLGVALRYGKGCPGDGNRTPRIDTLNGFPVVGNRSFKILVSGARPQSTALLFLGLSATKWGGFTLPLPLKNAGIPGCTLYAGADFIFTTPTVGGAPGMGSGSVPFSIPAIPSLRGQSLYVQWGVVDPGSKRPVPLTLSDALRLLIG